MSDWYFTKFGNDIPLPIASNEFTHAAMSGDGKTIAVGLLAYSPTDNNPNEGVIQVSDVAYIFNDQSQWAKLGDTMKFIYNLGPPNFPPLITKQDFDNRDNLDLSLSLSQDGNVLLGSMLKGTMYYKSSMVVW